MQTIPVELDVGATTADVVVEVRNSSITLQTQIWVLQSVGHKVILGIVLNAKFVLSSAILLFNAIIGLIIPML